MNSGSGGGCFGVDVWMDTAKLANMVITGFGQSKAVEQLVVC